MPKDKIAITIETDIKLDECDKNDKISNIWERKLE
jgi:hypothetical protein